MLKSVLCQRVKCYKSSLHDVCSPTKFHIMRAKQNCWKKKHEGMFNIDTKIFTVTVDGKS